MPRMKIVTDVSPSEWPDDKKLQILQEAGDERPEHCRGCPPAKVEANPDPAVLRALIRSVEKA
jgi:hypothetical protein